MKRDRRRDRDVETETQRHRRTGRGVDTETQRQGRGDRDVETELERQRHTDRVEVDKHVIYYPYTITVPSLSKVEAVNVVQFRTKGKNV